MYNYFVIEKHIKYIIKKQKIERVAFNEIRFIIKMAELLDFSIYYLIYDDHCVQRSSNFK